MTRIPFPLLLLAGSLATALLAFQQPEKAGWQSHHVAIAPDGTLTYIPDAEGNTIPDFSRVGYHQGDRPLPEVKVKKTVRPAAAGSSQELVQKAIDEVAAGKPDKNGFRGAILLRKGTYLIPGSLRINTGGIVLRGEGAGAGGTRLVATGKGQRALIVVSGTGTATEVAGRRRQITDARVPTGSFSLGLESVAGLKAGDKIMVFRPGTAAWISDLQMDRITAREGTRQWQPKDYDLAFERNITRIEGKRVFLDNPIVMAMTTKYGGGAVYPYTFPGRIAEVGVEHLLLESEYAGDTDEDHGWTAIQFNKIENGWVRNITARFFGFAAVSLEKDAKQVTVQDARCQEAKSVITGSRRYSFNNNGQLNLFRNLTAADGRHDYVTGAKVCGPNVFYNCSATRTHADIGPHHRWAAGTLYDNIVTDGEINVQDRGNWGSGHGWSGVTQVLWHCRVKRAAVQSPWVSGSNYAIGLQGDKYEGRLAGKPDGVWEGHNKAGLAPQSLYLAQLKARQPPHTPAAR
jgi:hypothetical protein